MQMDEGLDTGPILLREELPITPADTAGTLHDKLAALGALLIVRALAAAPAALPQDGSLATYAARITRDEAEIDWRDGAAAIERQVRAFDPVPGAHTDYEGALLKIWRARVENDADAAPGTICTAGSGGILVACGAGALRIIELQRAGGKRLAAGAFLAGCKLAPGARFGAR